ncbi:MAG: diphosphomevalonate decarboxylase [Balneolaceae bacterium]
MTPHSRQRVSITNSATAVAHANIALVKYWGKRTEALNLPAVGSISLTLDALKTETTVSFDGALQKDSLVLNGKPASEASLKRVSDFLNHIGGINRSSASIVSTNNFPTAAGLASSASGFAALALSATSALNLDLEDVELSKLARIGSGSAARSIYGGFVEMKCGNTDDGNGDYAISLFEQDYWDVRMLIAITSSDEKTIGSTEGMNRTANTSPFYSAWVQSQAADLDEMRLALKAKDFQKVGELTEHSCFKMHGLALSARPPLLYWNAATTETYQIIKELRTSGIPAYVTMDAGPQVKIFCLPEAQLPIRQALKTVKGIKSILECRPGPAVALKTLENV